MPSLPEVAEQPSAYGPYPPTGTIEEWRALFVFRINMRNRNHPHPDDPFLGWGAYVAERVKDYNPATGAYEPDGDINAIRPYVSDDTWNAI